jgi:hypothetical protein
LDGAVDRLVQRYLTEPVFHEVASSTQTVTAMEHRFIQVHQMDKVKVAAAICRSQEKSLFFVRTKRGADRLVENLGKEGIRAAPSTATSASQPGTGAGRFLLGQAAGPAPPMWRPAARTSRPSMAIHSIRPKTTRPTCRSGRTARREGFVVVSVSLWNQLF